MTIANTGASTINGWPLAFAYTAGQRVTMPGWGAAFTQSGSGEVTATNLAYYGTLASNASVSVGFNGAYNGSNPTPTSFAVNGSTCVVWLG